MRDERLRDEHLRDERPMKETDGRCSKTCHIMVKWTACTYMIEVLHEASRLQYNHCGDAFSSRLLDFPCCRTKTWTLI